MEIELHRGVLAALADGGTEVRVRFAGGVAAANHARFAVTAVRRDRARIIVERGTALIVVAGGKQQAMPTAGQFVEVNKLTTGPIITAAQSVRSDDANAVAEMAALRFVPATAGPSSKPPPATLDSFSSGQPAATASASPVVVAADGSSTNQPSTVAAPSLSPAADNPPAGQPSTVPTAALPSIPLVGQGAASLGSLVGVDPLQAPPNGANIKGLVISPEHP